MNGGFSIYDEMGAPYKKNLYKKTRAETKKG
jgi:hypothetical protein